VCVGVCVGVCVCVCVCGVCVCVVCVCVCVVCVCVCVWFSPQWVRASLLSRLHDHTQTTTLGMTPLAG